MILSRSLGEASLLHSLYPSIWCRPCLGKRKAPFAGNKRVPGNWELEDDKHSQLLTDDHRYWISSTWCETSLRNRLKPCLLPSASPSSRPKWSSPHLHATNPVFPGITLVGRKKQRVLVWQKVTRRFEAASPHTGCPKVCKRAPVLQSLLCFTKQALIAWNVTLLLWYTTHPCTCIVQRKKHYTRQISLIVYRPTGV